MAITPFEADLNIIGKLPDEPNDVGGLSPAELKARFDQAGNDIQKYVNETLIPQITEYIKEQLDLHNHDESCHFMRFAKKADEEVVWKHVTDEGNPHKLDYLEVGADKAGTAAESVTAHDGNAQAHASQFAAKQDTLTGTAGQVVGFDAQGHAIAVEAPKGGGDPYVMSFFMPGSTWVYPGFYDNGYSSYRLTEGNMKDAVAAFQAGRPVLFKTRLQQDGGLNRETRPYEGIAVGLYVDETDGMNVLSFMGYTDRDDFLPPLVIISVRDGQNVEDPEEAHIAASAPLPMVRGEEGQVLKIQNGKPTWVTV